MIVLPSLVAIAFAAFCPTAAEVAESVGFPVKVLPQGTRMYGQAEMCASQGASSCGTRNSASVHGHFGAARTKPYHLHRITRADFFGQLPFAFMRHAESGALV